MPGLDDFLGQWRLERIIDDRRAGERGRFDGTARITGDGVRAAYDETGLLRLPGRPPLTATRRYLWSAGAAGLEIAFADGRPFHHVPAAGGAAAHDCPPDRYAVVYDFSAWPDWTAVWTVTGPAKDYVAHSRYRR